MWQIKNDDGAKRLYQNNFGSKCTMTMCHRDRDGNFWWQFDDLLSLPYTRNFAATKVSSLYAAGISKDDLTSHISTVKSLLKSDDSEKYEKMYASVLDFESKVNNATNAIRQMTALVCVYFTINDEQIDTFDGSLQARKMELIEADPQMHAFFLNRQTELTESYTRHLQLLSQIALPIAK